MKFLSGGRVFRSCYGEWRSRGVRVIRVIFRLSSTCMLSFLLNFSFCLDAFTFVPLYSFCHLSCLSFFFLVLLFTCASFTGKTRWRSSSFLMPFLPGNCSLHSVRIPSSWLRSAIKLNFIIIIIRLNSNYVNYTFIMYYCIVQMVVYA